jgi:hypothetical protein
MKLSPEYQESTADLENFIEMKYVHSFVTNEHWIIGPEFRN